MTTQRQREANAANARRSTGPRSAEGRARSSANATSHGLNAAPDPKSVSQWYGVIVGRPGAEPPIPPGTERERRALELAIAEAQLERVHAREEAAFLHMTKGTLMHPLLGEIGDDPGALFARLMGDRTGASFDPRGRRGAARWLFDAIAEDLKSLRPRENALATLRRYRAAAEAARRRALRRWMQVEESKAENSGTKPISIKG